MILESIPKDLPRSQTSDLYKSEPAIEGPTFRGREISEENQRLIDQSNVTWRRSINTANTAAINAANQTDAQNLLNISNFALSALWQQWRDEASWVNTSAENQRERAHNIAIAALERETELALIDEEGKNELNGLLGQLGVKIFANKIIGE